MERKQKLMVGAPEDLRAKNFQDVGSWMRGSRLGKLIDLFNKKQAMDELLKERRKHQSGGVH